MEEPSKGQVAWTMLVARCAVVVAILAICLVFQWLNRHATITCHLCLLLVFFCFDAMSIGFLGLGDRPPLVAIYVLFVSRVLDSIRMVGVD